MFKDINLSIDNEKINYKYKIDKNKIIINTINKLKIGNTLKIFYDENIYELSLFTKFKKGKAGEIFIDLDEEVLSFSVILKYNFFVKSVYKYINQLINKETLINEIILFVNSKVGSNYKDDLNNLLDNIENKDKDLEDLIINNEDEYKRICNILLNNNTYINLFKKMSNLELMLLITAYIFVPYTPKIDQETFNDLISVAKDYDYALENIWRLGMNFDEKGYNFDELDDFFVNSKNISYLENYISSIIQIDQEKIVNKIIETKDKVFIKQILEESNLIIDKLDKKYKRILESVI